MTEKLQQIMKEEIAKLPKEKQEVFNSFDWGKITEEIGAKFSLGENELNDFQLETGLILLGLSNPDTYARRLEDLAGGEEGRKIFVEAFEKIFEPVALQLEATIKRGLVTKNPSFEQTINFIISGGNYLSFLDK